MPNPFPRSLPADFRIIFVEQGRERCESWYHARRTTIDRWLSESGKHTLIAERAAFVAFRRRLARQRRRGEAR